jgi:hypothetical protein
MSLFSEKTPGIMRILLWKDDIGIETFLTVNFEGARILHTEASWARRIEQGEDEKE